MRASSVSSAIIELLQEGHTHLSATEIYNALKVRFSAVNQSTVYRALKRLVDEGQASISDMGLGYMVYEGTGQKPHHHLVCQSCGKVFTIGDHEVGAFFSSIQNAYDFRVETTHLILYGICKHCQK